ncbi:DinB family protein [Brevibacillus ginsengisoli]|uniref:DinB family protein n=1 Tax=Brevibacillus ginsengisoli TaxID=363854 RepID=UPI003CE6EFC8
MQKAIESINTTTDQIAALVKGMDSETLNRKPSMDAWSIKEVLCHIEEAIPYWLREIEQLVKKPGAEWGRGLADEERLRAVDVANQRKIEDILFQIESNKNIVVEVLEGLTDRQLLIESPSRNPRFGTKPLRFIVDHLLVEHMQKHLEQIKRNMKQTV